MFLVLVFVLIFLGTVAATGRIEDLETPPGRLGSNRWGRAKPICYFEIARALKTSRSNIVWKRHVKANGLGTTRKKTHSHLQI